MPWRKQVQTLGLFLLILVFAALVAGIYLSIDARSAAAGNDIISIQSDIMNIDREIADMQAKLASLTSTTEMAKRARDLGFEPMQIDQTTYILVPGYIDRQTASLAPYRQPGIEAAPVLPPEYTESVFTWLGKNVLPTILPGLEVSK